MLDSIFNVLLITQDIWHDSFWQTLSQVVTALSTFMLSYVLARRDAKKRQRRKEITYEIISDIRLPPSLIGMISRVKLGSQVKPHLIVNDTHLVEIKIWNSGNVSIKRADYDADKTLEFDFKQRRVLACAVSHQEPERIVDKDELDTFLVISEPNKMKLARFLLENGQMIIVQAVVTGKGQKEEITGWARIEGNGKVVSSDKRTVVRLIPILLMLVSLSIIIVALRTFSIFLSVSLSFSLADTVTISSIALLTIIAAIFIFLCKGRLIVMRKNLRIKW